MLADYSYCDACKYSTTCTVHWGMDMAPSHLQSWSRGPIPYTIPDTAIKYCEISKEMSSLYFVLDVFCQFEAGVPNWCIVQCRVYTVQSTAVRVPGFHVKFRDYTYIASNRQNTERTKYNGHIPLLILQYVITDQKYHPLPEVGTLSLIAFYQ
jgi:hypothetical protein